MVILDLVAAQVCSSYVDMVIIGGRCYNGKSMDSIRTSYYCSSATDNSCKERKEMTEYIKVKLTLLEWLWEKFLRLWI